MDIICDKQLLTQAVDGVSRAVAVRSGNPVLEGIHLVANGFSLTLTGYDMEIAITVTIECNVRQNGECVLNAKLLGDMVRRMPSNEVKIVLDDNSMVTVSGGMAQFELAALNTNDFPELPKPGADPTMTLKTREFRDVIEKSIYAVSQDLNKPAHTGELFLIEPEKLTVVALDGYRLAVINRNFKAKKEIRIIIPSKTLNEVCKIMGDGEDDEIEISANRRFVVFTTNNGYTVISRLIEGEFLDYNTVMPKGSRTTVSINTRDFIACIERASLIVTERLKNPLRIKFGNGKVTVRCQTQLGKVVEEFDAVTQGDEVEIGFNNRYLLDALRAGKCETIKFEINGPLSPVKILPADGSEFTYLVLPVRFKND